MRRIVRAIARVVVLVAIGLVSVWSALALWYQLPGPDWARGLAALLFMVVALGVFVTFIRGQLVKALLTFAIAFAAVLAWWVTILPPSQGDFAPDVARQVTGRIEGDVLTLTNVREFEWRSDTDFTEHWTTRSYDLAKLRTLDLFLSYWAGPEMAHTIFSFGFEGGDYLAWSIEVRRSKGGEFSPIADLFKSNPLVIIATQERDVVRVRSNIRGEDVQLYRLRTSPEVARRLLLQYVADADAIAAEPQFYNSLMTNCTTTVVQMLRATGASVPFDWRFVVNGYLPSFLYERGSLDGRQSLDALKQAAHIDERAKAADASPDFSRLIRNGVPSPHDTTLP